MQHDLSYQQQEEFIQQCIEGDMKCQKQLYSMYMPAMYNRSVRMLNRREDAKDVVQEVFVKVFRDLHQLKDMMSVGAWIKRITINSCISFLRKNRMIEVEWDSQAVDIPDEEADLDINVEMIHEAIRQLPTGARMVFTLHVLEGYKHIEIAEILNISLSTSKTQYRRAKLILQSTLKARIYE